MALSSDHRTRLILTLVFTLAWSTAGLITRALNRALTRALIGAAIVLAAVFWHIARACRRRLPAPQGGISAGPCRTP